MICSSKYQSYICVICGKVEVVIVRGGDYVVGKCCEVMWCGVWCGGSGEGVVQGYVLMGSGVRLLGCSG